MNHIRWERVEAHVGPPCTYGYWEDAKCFNIFWNPRDKSKNQFGPTYQINCALPGFRKDLPLQNTEEEAKAFCEKMLTRWVAKRGLLFKGHVIITDAMRKAAREAAVNAKTREEEIDVIITAALAARG